MRNGFRLCLMGALGVGLCATLARAADDPKKDDDKSKPNIKIDTLDGVRLDATLWPADPQGTAKEKQATILLLHNIDKKSGGDSHQDNWDDLAKKLSQQGFSVLSFDFRGFGKSKTVDKDIFWDPNKGRHNLEYVKGGGDHPTDTITHENFDNRASEYYPYLVNDIAAAKSYLDRRTGESGINSSNLILVGAGEGATLGAMWMATQWHLKKVSGVDKVTGRFTYDQPEGRDEAGAVWLSISPRLGGRDVQGLLTKWLVDSAGDNKVPMAFLYGGEDESAQSLAKAALRAIESRMKRDNPKDDIKQRMELMAPFAIEKTSVSGSKLLGVDKTAEAIANYAKTVIDKRGATEARNHTPEKEDVFVWTFPGMARPVNAKTRLDETIQLIPVKEFLMSPGG